MRAIDLISPTIVRAAESTTLVDAANLMRDSGVGDVVITRNGGRDEKTIGIVTDRDIVVHAIACGVNLEAITVGDLRLRDPAVVSPDADLVEITETMNENAVRRVLVQRGTELMGVVSLDDVISAVAELLNNLTAMLARQIEYEKEHVVQAESQESAA